MPSSWEKLQVSGSEMDLYTSFPDGLGPFPVVVVAQHGAGVDSFIQKMCERLAEEGYATVAPSLYHRITDAMLADGSRPIHHLIDSEIIADIGAAVDFLRAQPSVDGERIGITGFCLGGRVAWLGAATNPHFKAAVSYYGANLMVSWGDGSETPLDRSSGINCPLLFHFGEVDENPSQDDMRMLDNELSRLGKPHQFFVYPGADHAFMDSTSSRHRRQAAEASWPRTLYFFSKHLKGIDVNA